LRKTRAATNGPAIRREGFRKELSAKATLIGQFQVRSALYADDDRHIRLQVILLPSSSGMVVPCYLLTSLLKDGTQVITDNLFLPFGGFYPENWHVERRPWKRSFSRLMRRHRDRILPHRDELATWETDVLDDLQEQPRMLDRLNVEMGFFFPVHERDEEGRITREGRYRVWKELWLLKYFGIPLKT